MNFKKTTDRIEALQKLEESKTQNASQQIDDLREELVTTTAKIEETYTSGDIETGTKLTEKKSLLESKISFLETFISKQKDVPSVADEEAKEIIGELQDELYRGFLADKKLFDRLMKEITAIIDNGIKALEIVENSENTVVRLQKKQGISYGIDGRISGFYRTLERFANSYRTQTAPSIKTLIEAEENK